MKRLLSILLCSFMVFSNVAFASPSVQVGVETPAEAVATQNTEQNAQLYATTTAQLYYYQDFENLPLGEVDLSTIESLITPTGDVTVSLGYIAGTVNGKYEIAEENGNKYLKVSGAGAVTLGGHFSDNAYRYSSMSFNYKYKSADSAKPLVRFDECTNNTLKYYSDWAYLGAGQTPTEWTHLAVSSAAKGEAIGVGFHWENNVSYEVHIDDIKVWCDNYADASLASGGASQYQQVEVNFSAGSGVDAAGVTMPKIGSPWEGLRTIYVPTSSHDSQVYSRVNLNSYTPKGTPAGYIFSGWSLTDGGKVIKENEYDDFRITGPTTFYAVWDIPNITVTLEADSSKGTVSTDTIFAVLGQNIDLTKIKVTPVNDQLVFLGWIEKNENGSFISADTTKFTTDSDITLVAVFAHKDAPVTSDGVQIRTRTPMGMRSVASVTFEQKENAVEYGYIVALTKDLSGEELTFESSCKKTFGKAYVKDTDTDIVFELDADRIYFTGVFHGIPKNRQGYTTSLTFRPYLKTSDGTYYYGREISKSLYQTALEIKENDNFVNMPLEEQKTINDIISVGTPPIITNGNAEDADNVAFTSDNANITIIDDTRFGGNKVYNVEALNTKNAYTYFVQQGVKYEEGKRYYISFDICYTGYTDANYSDDASAAFAVNFRYNDTTDSTSSFKDHLVHQFGLAKGEWKRVNCSYVVSNLEDNSVSQFAIYASPSGNEYSRNFMVDNVVVEATEEYKFELVGKTYDINGNEKDPTSFDVGEQAVFKIGVYEGNNASVNCKYIKYTVSYDDGQKSHSEVVDASNGEITVTTNPLTKPGAVRVVASVCDEAGNELKVNNANYPNDLSFHFNGGIIAGFDDIRLTTVETASEKAEVDVAQPENVLVFEEIFAEESFDEFWNKNLSVISDVDYSKAEISVAETKSGFTVYEVYVPFALPGDAENTKDNKAAFYMSVPTGAAKESLGIRAYFQGYGVANPSMPMLNGYITLSVSAHSMLLGQPNSYYTSLNAQGGALNQYGLNRQGVEVSADESYFVGMLLRDMVAVNFAKQYTQDGNVLFDGNAIELDGGSQGGFQATAVASFMGNEATKLTLNVPWMCDLNAFNTARQNHEFRPTWADSGCHIYFDTGLFAKRVTCDTTINAGLGDYTCPPAGIIGMYHNLGSQNKSITFNQNMVHSTTIPPLSSGMSYTRAN